MLVALLAFANGSNDNSKSVATLVGFGAARPMPALVYATLATALGGLISFHLASGMLKGFSGGFLFTQGIVLDQRFYISVLIGACGWVFLATRTGMPVSTTHAIVGALTGSGLVAYGNGKFQWGTLGQKFAIPLVVSPVLSLVIVYVIAWPVIALVSILATKRVVLREEKFEATSVLRESSQVQYMEIESRETITPASPVANGIHWISCGLISFARGWNDTPKIAALSMLALSSIKHDTVIGFSIVAISMAAGGLIMGRRVLETLSRKLTPLPLAESLTASLVTAALVGFASKIALPVSTTHVATGSIIGAGLKSDPAVVKWGKVGEVVLSWIITLPVAAAIAAIAKLVLR
jgi:PiT family inorganic phosphate transporter